MEYVEAGGARIPAIGLGTWQNTGTQCAETVETALELGYRHVDTAQVYDNERRVGDGLAASAVDREEVFLTTKLWRSNLRATDVRASVRDSLDRLGVERVDLLLIHWPHPRIPIEETIGAMDGLVDDGLVVHIGVSNFTASQVGAAADAADNPIVTDQLLYHPYVDQSARLALLRDRDVSVTAYSPLARGGVLEDEVLAEIGDRYDKGPAQVSLRWLIQHDGVLAVPKATTRSHLAANRSVFDFELTDAEMTRVATRRPGPARRVKNRLPAVMRRWPL
jgi:diketogulonate reductase-like aldo/keto reductase